MRATARRRERKSAVNGRLNSIHRGLVDLLGRSISNQVRNEVRFAFDDSILWPVIMVYTPIRGQFRDLI